MQALGRLYDIGSAFAPVDFNTSDAATGHRVYMGDCGAIDFVIFKGAGTAGADPVLDVQEHTASSSGTSRDLDVITEFYSKTETALDGDELWTRTTQSAASEVNLGATSAEEEGIHVIHIEASSLSSDCAWISVNVSATVANAQLIAGLYIKHDLKVEADPTRLPSMLRATAG